MSFLFRLLLITSSAVILLLSYQQQQHPQLKYNSIQHRLTYPLDTRVRYRIGEIDPRFGLSSTQVKQLTQEAIAIWHQGTGKEWFVYDDSAQLVINFIYDERQQRTTDLAQKTKQLQQIEQQRQQQQEFIQRERQALQQKSQALQTQKRQLEQFAQEYQTLYQQYAQQPQYYHVLMQHYQHLQQRQNDFNTAVQHFKMEETSLNFKIDRFNQLTDTLNDKIRQIKKQFPAEPFHVGEFHGKHINVYQYSSIDDLRLTLAHEFGHALTLAHHHDPKGLMYPTNAEQDVENFRLTPADIQLLQQR